MCRVRMVLVRVTGPLCLHGCPCAELASKRHARLTSTIQTVLSRKARSISFGRYVEFRYFVTLACSKSLLLLLQECRNKWIEKRTENCIPPEDGKKRKFEKCDLNTFRSEEAYTNIFQKGTAEPVAAFLIRQGYDLKSIGNETKQLKFVQEDLSGPKYPVHTSQRSRSSIHAADVLAAKVHHHESGQAAKSSFAGYRQGVHGMSKNFCKQEEVEAKVREHRSKQALHEILSDVGVEAAKDDPDQEQDESEDEDMGFDDLAPVAAASRPWPYWGFPQQQSLSIPRISLPSF
eukprot:s1002_g15.t1